MIIETEDKQLPFTMNEEAAQLSALGFEVGGSSSNFLPDVQIWE